MSDVAAKTTAEAASRPEADHLAEPTAPTAGPRAAKSKKKKGGGSGANGQGENTGRWTTEEHRLFLQGLEQHGKGWKKIASLIKSRTVVQIRTHAQKYFQKLAKARQNGDEGEVTMEGRGGLSTTGGHAESVGGGVAPPSKRRRPPLAGTKRKVISSIVQSAQKEGKKMAVAGKANPLPAVAPALATFVVPARDSAGASVPTFATAQGTISGPALEDSIFRFLTPAPVATSDAPVLNDIARQAGANPITLPTDNPSSAPSNGSGEVSPTGVADISIFPSWTDAKDPPSWYAKGADVDALLDVGGALDWLADSGDLHEDFVPPPIESSANMPDVDVAPFRAVKQEDDMAVDYHRPENYRHGSPEPEEKHHLATISSSAELPQTMDDSNMDQVVPPLPSIFDGSPNPDEHYSDYNGEDAPTENQGAGTEKSPDMPVASASATDLLLTSTTSSAKLVLHDEANEGHHETDGDLGDATLFDSEMERDFVSTLLENSESAVDLTVLHE